MPGPMLHIYRCLLAPSINALQLLLNACESELCKLNLCINSSKSVCVRIGPRYHIMSKFSDQ